jgi:hypothetical protein
MDRQALFDAVRILGIGSANAVYCILQPHFANRKEYEVIILGGTARYVTASNREEGLKSHFNPTSN